MYRAVGVADIRCGRWTVVILVIGIRRRVMVEWRKNFFVAVDATRTAGGYFEDIHMQSAGLVPAQETMIVVHLDAARAEVVGEVGAALLRFAL